MVTTAPVVLVELTERIIFLVIVMEVAVVVFTVIAWLAAPAAVAVEGEVLNICSILFPLTTKAPVPVGATCKARTDEAVEAPE